MFLSLTCPPLPQIFHCVFENKVFHRNQKINCSVGQHVPLQSDSRDYGEKSGREHCGAGGSKGWGEGGAWVAMATKAAVALIRCPGLPPPPGVKFLRAKQSPDAPSLGSAASALAPRRSLSSPPPLAALAGGHHELAVVLGDRRRHRGLVPLRLHCFRRRRTPHLRASPAACVRCPSAPAPPASTLAAAFFRRGVSFRGRSLQSSRLGAGERKGKQGVAPAFKGLRIF